MNKIAVVIPCYNNVKTVFDVVSSAMQFCSDIIVVFDGCTDGSREAIAPLENKVFCLEYSPNKGKGNALRMVFDFATERGYDYVVTMDADGQHFAADLPLFFKTIEKNYGAMVVGCRYLEQDNMPAGNRFANKFSNFWFTVQTGVKLSDTQTGYRGYPIFKMKHLRNFTNRYEAELELLVRMAWKNFKIVSIPIGVYYAPEEERVSHFRKGRDFFRISLLNTFFSIAALFYGYPSKLLHKIKGNE